MMPFFVEGDSEFELTDKVNNHLDKISLQCTANKLSLSPDKTCYSIFGNYSHTGNIKSNQANTEDRFKIHRSKREQ